MNSNQKQKSLSASSVLQKVGKPVAYYPSIARVLGSVKSAVFLCQFLYWEGKQRDPAGWIYKTSAEIAEETGLSRDEQEGARKRLRDLGILKEKKKGIPATLHFLFDWGKFDDLFTVQTSLEKNYNLDWRKSPNLIGENLQSIPETTDIEDDAEITTEREEERGPGLSLSSSDYFASRENRPEGKESKDKDPNGTASFPLPGKNGNKDNSPEFAGGDEEDDEDEPEIVKATARQIAFAKSLCRENGIEFEKILHEDDPAEVFGDFISSFKTKK